MNRREFIRSGLGALGFTALPGGALFAAPPGWKHGGRPNVVFGVVSDTHLRTVHGSSGRPGHNWPNKYFAAALRYFRDQNVDAVVHCGDLAHRGQVEEMQFHANVWNSTFPKNLAPDGHEVVKLFVTGNHDTDGAKYGDFVEKNYPDPEVRARHVLQTDMAANWQRIWGEKYEPVWHKTVKGYHFFGRNYRVGNDALAASLKGSEAVFAECRAKGRPFFYFQHSRPLWDVRKVLLRHSGGANPVSFFGHNHWSAANWNIISLYYGRLPCIEVPSCEPRGCGGLVADAWITKSKIEKTDAAGKGRQGYVVRLYDDMMVVERREFGAGGSLGADWVMPFGKSPHPFTKGELKKVVGEPQFREGAKPEIVKATQEAAGVQVKIPLADGNPDSRVYAYEVVAVGDEGAPKLHKAVYAAGVNLGAGHEPAGGVTTLALQKSELPAGKRLTVAVRPVSSLGTRGRPIAATCDLT
ncbi:MAG: metallophosphoesterase [Kiritimatiellae bacterium]|nr:metallophosphoesterase [Kiritimatiellia bacterium]